MNKLKQYTGWIIKLTIGFVSFIVIYMKLKDSLDEKELELLWHTLSQTKNLLFFMVVCLLLFVNWGIESYKWKLITNDVEIVSYKTAVKSVLSGVCVGNLAPGRATEFLAKIHFFKQENKAAITILHFMNGLFQLMITIFAGITALLFHFAENELQEYNWLRITLLILSVILVLVFIALLFKINHVVEWLYLKLNKTEYIEPKQIRWTKLLMTQLLSLSVVRYIVFGIQFILTLMLFTDIELSMTVIYSIALYFLATTVIPMYSVTEAPVRIAIAMVVFKSMDVSSAAIAFTAFLIWLINIVVPSILGYLILVRENLSIKSFSLKMNK